MCCTGRGRSEKRKHKHKKHKKEVSTCFAMHLVIISSAHETPPWLQARVPSFVQCCCWQHKKSKDKDKDKALLAETAKKAKEFLKQHLKDGGKGGSGDGTAGPGSSAVDRGPVAGKPAGTPDISADDYFIRAPEFTAWVQEQKHLLFNGEQLAVFLCNACLSP